MGQGLYRHLRQSKLSGTLLECETKKVMVPHKLRKKQQDNEDRRKFRRETLGVK